MRLLLDANLSGRAIAVPLRRTGHDMRALTDDPALEGLDDPDVLALAASEDRMLVTRNSRDFAPLAREWAEAGRGHAGLILIWTLDHSRFADIVRGVERTWRSSRIRTNGATSSSPSEGSWSGLGERRSPPSWIVVAGRP